MYAKSRQRVRYIQMTARHNHQFGLQEIYPDVLKVERKFLTHKKIVAISLVIMFGVAFLLFAVLSPHFHTTNYSKLVDYSNTGANGAAYGLKIPIRLVTGSSVGLDNTNTFVDSQERFGAFVRVSTSYTGAIDSARLSTVVDNLKDSNSALFRGFADTLSSNTDYTNFHLGSFEITTVPGAVKALVSRISFENKKGVTLIGRLVLSYGSKTQYSLMVASDSKTWSSNEKTWAQVISSFNIK